MNENIDDMILFENRIHVFISAVLKDDVMWYRTFYIGIGHGSYVGRKWIMTIALTRAIVPTTAALYCLEMTAIKIPGNHHYPNDIKVDSIILYNSRYIIYYTHIFTRFLEV